MKRLVVLLALLVLLTAVGIWSWMAKPWEAWYAPTNDKHSTTALRIERFDRVLDEYVSLGSYNALQRMNSEFPMQTKLLIENVLELGSVDEPDIEKRLRYFYLDSTVQVILDEVHRQYGDLSDVEAQLADSLKKLEHRHPAYRRPHLYAQISCLKQSIVVSDTLIGISLDKYLGSDFPPYQDFYSEEQRSQMTRASIVSDAINAYDKYLQQIENE